MQIDINCDMGEGIGNEDRLMPFISSANIACGFHAGNETEMKRVVELCLQYQVAIGAHPSFPDKENFGRTPMHLPFKKIQSLVLEQLCVLEKIVRTAGGKLHHVKPHGALYNMAAKDASLASALAETVKDFDDNLVYYGLAGSVMIDEAVKLGLRVANEVFADRTYQLDGSLTPRSETGALITSAGKALLQVLQMVNKKTVTATTGETIYLKADTICLHGDAAAAVEFAEQMNLILKTSGIQIKTI